MKRIGCYALVAVFVAFIYGVIVGNYKIFPYSLLNTSFVQLQKLFSDSETTDKKIQVADGRWSKLDQLDIQTNLDSKDLGQLAGNPYLQGYIPAPSLKGVTVHIAERANQGFNLFCSGHAPKVFLMSMNGKIVHEWDIPFGRIWPNRIPEYRDKRSKDYIRRAYLFPNGDLLAIFEYLGMVKVDKDSNVVWKYKGSFHHDLDVAANGNIIALGQQVRDIEQLKERYPNLPRNESLMDDVVVVLDENGSVIQEVSLFDAFANSNYAVHLNLIRGIPHDDVFHTNTVDIVSNEIANELAFVDPGDILISIRNLDMIAIVNLSTETIKWALTGMWRRQHQASFMANGNILLLDNHWWNSESLFAINKSRVIEINPTSQEIVWRYEGAEDSPFFTSLMGYNQRLTNGNTLITSSNQGRMFEVTPDNQIVWEYFSPFRAGENDELIATLMGGQRIDIENLPFLNNAEN